MYPPNSIRSLFQALKLLFKSPFEGYYKARRMHDLLAHSYYLNLEVA